MIYTVLKENSYQDSINLMLLTNHISTMNGINKVQVMMGTDANKDIFNSAGLLSKEAENAKPSDMVIVMDTDNEMVVGHVMREIDKFLSDLSVRKEEEVQKSVKSWSQVKEHMPDANLALISVPGICAVYVAPEFPELITLVISSIRQHRWYVMSYPLTLGGNSMSN